MNPKRLEEIKALVHQAGMSFVSAERRSGNAVSVRAMAPNGKTGHFTISSVTGDKRSDQEHMQDLRRFARENGVAPAEEGLSRASVEKLDKFIAGKQGDRADRVKRVLDTLDAHAAPANVNPPAPVDRPPVPPGPPTADVKPRNQLSHAEFFRLCSWLQAKSPLPGVHSQVALAKVASIELGFEVTEHNAKTALEATGVTLQSAPLVSRAKNPDRVRALAAEIIELRRELGTTASKRLLALAAGNAFEALEG